MYLSGTKKFPRSSSIGLVLKITDTVRNVIKGIKWRRESQLNFLSGFVMNLTYRNRSGPYVKATKGKEYISSNVVLIRADISSIQIRNIHAAISLFAIVNGFLVEISRPEKKDWEIPIYNMGSMFTIKLNENDNYHSNIAKTR
jgi:hypothetical protein